MIVQEVADRYGQHGTHDASGSLGLVIARPSRVLGRMPMSCG